MKIKLVLTDIDGVWTDGGMYYDNSGNEWKKFNTADSAGVILLRQLNVPVGIITGESNEIIRRRAAKLKIDLLFMGVADKLKVAGEIIESLGLDWEELAYVGDDLNDLALLQKAGISAVPAGVPAYVASKARWVLNRKGGDGAFREFAERLMEQENLLNIAIDKFLKGIF
jgi:3-deoxy-D-manno-octulosonate 8-phosphate phosphatase (KDO 8-P phosphatase)